MKENRLRQSRVSLSNILCASHNLTPIQRIMCTKDEKTMKTGAPGKYLPNIPTELIGHFVTDTMIAAAVMAASLLG